MNVKIIVAMCKNRGIGYQNSIPWRIKEDMLYFANNTGGAYAKFVKDAKDVNNVTQNNTKPNIKKNAIIMGKNTWLSLPTSQRPLKNRDNLILSTSMSEIYPSSNIDLTMYFSLISRIYTFCYYDQEGECGTNDSSIESSDEVEKHDALEKREINRNSMKSKTQTKTTIKPKTSSKYETIWVIGGTQIYDTFMNNGGKTDIIIEEFYITYIDNDYECDTFFPAIENMNRYYISSFIKSESKDEKTNCYLPVYYIIFTLIDSGTNDDIERVNLQNKEGSKYYYYIKKDLLCTKEMTDYITIDNIDSFLWCITRF
jgi:dihydrofolate reductase